MLLSVGICLRIPIIRFESLEWGRGNNSENVAVVFVRTCSIVLDEVAIGLTNYFCFTEATRDIICTILA